MPDRSEPACEVTKRATHTAGRRSRRCARRKRRRARRHAATASWGILYAVPKYCIYSIDTAAVDASRGGNREVGMRRPRRQPAPSRSSPLQPTGRPTFLHIHTRDNSHWSMRSAEHPLPALQMLLLQLSALVCRTAGGASAAGGVHASGTGGTGGGSGSIAAPMPVLHRATNAHTMYMRARMYNPVTLPALTAARRSPPYLLPPYLQGRVATC